MAQPHVQCHAVVAVTASWRGASHHDDGVWQWQHLIIIMHAAVACRERFYRDRERERERSDLPRCAAMPAAAPPCSDTNAWHQAAESAVPVMLWPPTPGTLGTKQPCRAAGCRLHHGEAGSL